MFKNAVIIIAIIIIAAVALTGCVNLLETNVESISKHYVEPFVRPPTERISVSGYDELMETMIMLIMEHETEVRLLYHPHNGEDVQAEVLRTKDEIMHIHPIGAYAVADIEADATRIVSYFEVDIEIEYKRTKEQLDSIVNVATLRYMMTPLLDTMSEYREEAIIRTNLDITEDDITAMVIETYYQNPRRIVMLPFVTVDIFPKTDILPDEGIDRIYEIKFGFTTENPSMLQRYSEDLRVYVTRNAALANGDTNAELYLSMVMNLIQSASFDEGVARTIHVHGAQNFSATAFGALVGGSAVGEGFAMAFKALCDELRLDNRIVLGLLDGRVHAWNIVSINGDFYHIDAAMSYLNGIETAFLKTDADFAEMYTWDRVNTVRCNGELTLEDIIGIDDPDDINNPDDPNNNGGDDNPDNINNQNGNSNNGEGN
jgi:hypothetical protein